MREIRHADRDTKLLPPRRNLGPGERIVNGERMYSAAWLDADHRPRPVSPLSARRRPGPEASDLRAKLAHPLADLRDRLGR